MHFVVVLTIGEAEVSSYMIVYSDHIKESFVISRQHKQRKTLAPYLNNSSLNSHQLRRDLKRV